MGKFWLTIIIIILAGIGAIALYLMTVDLAPPKTQVEKTLPDDSFPK